MSKVVVIKGHPLDATASKTMAVLEQFLETYRQENPNDVVEILDVYADDVPEIDKEVLQAWQQLTQGAAFTTLTTSQQHKVGRLNEILEQFMTADKYVVANPLWNLMIPTKVKAWIDAVLIAGKTFRYTETSAEPIVPEKTAVHIQSAGGHYDNQDPATKYVAGALGFVNVKVVAKVSIEGIDHAPQTHDAVMAQAMQDAQAAARQF